MRAWQQRHGGNNDAVRMPRQALFLQKISGFPCYPKALRKIKQLRANAVETWLGVAGT